MLKQTICYTKQAKILKIDYKYNIKVEIQVDYNTKQVKQTIKVNKNELDYNTK